jgi:hypothetical protein
MGDDGGSATSPAQRRLDEHLELLRRDDAGNHEQLVHHIAQRARWQRALRAPIQLAAAIVASVSDGLRSLLSGGKRR